MSVSLFNLYGVYASTVQQEETDVPAAESNAQWKYDILDNGLAYRIHDFTLTTVGDPKHLEVTRAGDFNILVVGGGGSGGGRKGGGGSGGQVIENTTPLTANTYTVSVGDGGQSVEDLNPGLAGENSSFGSIIAEGGGGGNSEAGTGQQGYNAGGGSAGHQTPASPDGGNAGGQGNSGGGGGGAGAGEPGHDATASLPGNGGDGSSSSITGGSVLYGAGGSGADSSVYGSGGDFGGGDAHAGAIGSGGRNGYGAGGGASGFTNRATGKGGYGRVIVRHRVPSVDPDFGQVPPEPVTTKYMGLWDAQRRYFTDNLPFWGNVIKSGGTNEDMLIMYNNTGLPVIWSGFGFSPSQDESEWVNRIMSNKSLIHEIGSDNMYWILIEDEPGGFGYDGEERLIELCREILNTDGQTFKFGYTVQQTFALSVGSQGGKFYPIAGNADYIQVNNYIFRGGAIYGDISNQSEFNELMDNTMENLRTRVGPNTRFGITMQAFYGYNNDPPFTKPPDDAPYWWAEYVINAPDIDGILCYEWWNRTSSNGTGLRDSTMAGFWANLQDAYNIYFANQ